MVLMRGKLPARENAVKFAFRDFVDTKVLFPTVPAVFGHVVNSKEQLQALRGGWGMLGNDQAGNCVIAGADHTTMVYGLATGRRPLPRFTAKLALNDYRLAQIAQGLAPWNPHVLSSDTGLDLQKAAEWFRTVGVADASGNRHRIRGYARIDSYDDLCLAVYLFGVAWLGLSLPADAERVFEQKQVWIPSGPPEDGHLVPVVGRNSAQDLICITWGRTQGLDRGYFDKYGDEVICLFSLEYLLATGKSPESFDVKQLDDRLTALGHH